MVGAKLGRGDKSQTEGISPVGLRSLAFILKAMRCHQRFKQVSNMIQCKVLQDFSVGKGTVEAEMPVNPME